MNKHTAKKIIIFLLIFSQNSFANEINSKESEKLIKQAVGNVFPDPLINIINEYYFSHEYPVFIMNHKGDLHVLFVNFFDTLLSLKKMYLKKAYFKKNIFSSEIDGLKLSYNNVFLDKKDDAKTLDILNIVPDENVKTLNPLIVDEQIN